ncbi:unnamed protein product [Rotaria sp. Silwood1]|nr:unnamed protein product [Rotaria sp. Silwood1]
MSYNIRLDIAQDGQNQWSLRKDRLTSLIRYHRPDIFGVQEALPQQMADLKMALPIFDWYGVGRDDGKNRGEFSAVFYRSDRYEILDNGTFWLSETPDIAGSLGWDAANIRHAVKLASYKLTSTKRPFFTFASMKIVFVYLLLVKSA